MLIGLVGVLPFVGLRVSMPYPSAHTLYQSVIKEVSNRVK